MALAREAVLLRVSGCRSPPFDSKLPTTISNRELYVRGPISPSWRKTLQTARHLSCLTHAAKLPGKMNGVVVSHAAYEVQYAR